MVLIRYGTLATLRFRIEHTVTLVSVPTIEEKIVVVDSLYGLSSSEFTKYFVSMAVVQ